MKSHLRGNLLLLILTVGIACVLYPAVLWVFANVFFPGNAAGSLVKEKDAIRGSSSIGQNFSKDWYFKPRPSATSPSYNATASGGSNWGANNPKLRDRVARQLGSMVKYNQEGLKKNDSVQKDIESWFVANYQPDRRMAPLPVRWASDYPTLAAAWMKSDANRPAVIDWLRHYPQILAEWKKFKLEELKKSDPDAKVLEPDLSDATTIPFEEITKLFFESVAATREFDRHWLEPEDFDTEDKDAEGRPVKGKRFKPVSAGQDIQETFFDLWLQAHPDPDLLQKVPADMVMASGSGLDPHITLRSARFQMQRVVAERAKALNRDPSMVRASVEAIVQKYTFTPLSGLIGEPLVNVVEVNFELDKDLPMPVQSTSTP